MSAGHAPARVRWTMCRTITSMLDRRTVMSAMRMRPMSWRWTTMGADGSAILFVTPSEGEYLTAIEHFSNQVIERYEIPDFEAFSKRPPKAEVVSVKAEAFREKKRKAWMRL